MTCFCVFCACFSGLVLHVFFALFMHFLCFAVSSELALAYIITLVTTEASCLSPHSGMEGSRNCFVQAYILKSCNQDTIN